MKVLIVSGIWPPDVGGPASHAPEVAGSCARRGHEVEVVTTADAPPAPRGVSGALGRRGRCRRASATCARRRARSRGARGAPTSSTRRACRPRGRRRRARPRAVRRQADRRPGLRARAAVGALSTATLDDVPGRRRRAARTRCCAPRATPPCGAPRTSSARARTCATLVVGWGVRPSASTCCRTPRRECRDCRRVTSCDARSASTGRRSPSPAG